MDLQRLKELEKLAGLSLDPGQRQALLSDLIQLEEFASHLPEVSSAQSEEKEDLNQAPSSSVSLDMDRHQARANAPAMENGFYKIPSTHFQPDGDSS